ncbi:sugar ABC transporter ATP-binding protein [Candidatus Aerophobetes bacterium]|nr:sugar ABC transporter ATP-binding protein [Candidatus Aerophobetes bacterium]
MSQVPIIELKNIRKFYGKIEALKGVDFLIYPGEIVGLVGDNGAGKSTLVKIMMGVFPPDAGEIFVEGKKVNLRSPSESRKFGFEPVYQETDLISQLNIWRNFFLGKEITKKFFIAKFLDKKKMRDITSKALDNIGIKIKNPDSDIMALSGGERRSVSIGRAWHFGGKILILDEPVTGLSVKETEKVLEYLKKIKKTGCSVVIITHNIYHVYDVADRIAILDRGTKVAEMRKEDCTPEEIMDIIRGKKKIV